MLRLVFLLLPLLLLACNNDDDSDPDRFCLDPEELSNCRDLSTLSVSEHTAAITGEWYLVNVVTSGAFTNVSRRCGRDLTSANFLIFNMDGTYTSFDTDVALEGNWSIVRDTTGNGEPFTRLETDNSLYFGAFDFVCDDDLAYHDQRSFDGPYRLFRKR